MHFDQTRKSLACVAFAVLISLPGLNACAADPAGPVQANLPMVQVRLGKQEVNAELANTPLSRQIGLMNRKKMAENAGMLFVFPQDEVQCMWMRNTLIDLDVAFADERGKILNVEKMKAGTSDIHCSKGKAKLALEMNRNWFSERSIREGEVIQVPESALKLE